MLIAALVCAALYGLIVIGLYVGQRKILFRCDAAEVDPATLGLKAKVVRLKTEDGESLLAWSIPPLAGRPLILYFHGNAGGIDLRVERFHAIAKAGMGLIAIEYRGYASSTGSPSERGLKLDGEAAYAAAIANGVAPERIVPLGELLGSGVAVALAARHKVGALVLELALFVDRRRRGGHVLVCSGSRLAPRSVPQRLADRLGRGADADRARDKGQGRAHPLWRESCLRSRIRLRSSGGSRTPSISRWASASMIRWTGSPEWFRQREPRIAVQSARIVARSGIQPQREFPPNRR